ncbi:MAG TPA: septation protein A [Burkholderiales bacterium]|nr:septation protein A [Burkholderiales bacterium]
MKFLFDLFPVILFFLAYSAAKRMPDTSAALASSLLAGIGVGGQVAVEQGPILLATVVAILATFAQVGWLVLRRRKVDRMLWISLIIIVGLGGATVVLRDATFIKWKPTVLYWTFAAVLLGADVLFKKNLVRTMVQEQIRLPDTVWTRLNLSWVVFFAFMGAANLFVAYHFSESAWVNFKLFGGIGLMLVFVLVQALMLSRYVEDQGSK